MNCCSLLKTRRSLRSYRTLWNSPKVWNYPSDKPDTYHRHRKTFIPLGIPICLLFSIRGKSKIIFKAIKVINSTQYVDNYRLCFMYSPKSISICKFRSEFDLKLSSHSANDLTQRRAKLLGALLIAKPQCNDYRLSSIDYRLSVRAAIAHWPSN